MKTISYSRALRLMLLCASFYCIPAWGQQSPPIASTDSIQAIQQDSLLAAQQARSKMLLHQADSIHISDSLEQAELLENIANLQANDQQHKQELQARLDSLQQAHAERDKRIQKQVDSLRANTPGVPVVIFGDTVFYIFSKLGPFSPRDRAESIAKKIVMLVDQNLFDPKLLKVLKSEESHDLVHEQLILLSITDRDAFWLGKSRESVAKDYEDAIKTSVQAYQKRTGVWATLKYIGLVILVLAIFFFGIRYLNKGFNWLKTWVHEKSKRYINGVKLKNYEILSKEREEMLLKWVLNSIKWACILFLFYMILPVVFSIFPATRSIANTLIGYVVTPLKGFGSALLGYIPELITIIVIVWVVRNLLKFLKFVSSEVASGKLQLQGFYADWAEPTYNLLKIIIYILTFIAIFPYLPGSHSPIFQGVSVFLGLLISLGSSSAIGNIIAGLVITYMRAFKLGDRVKIADTTGDVIEKTLLVTRLRTIKNEDVTIPNISILNGSTVNFSSSSQTLGLILNSTVTIGYDVPWRTVHELLIKAALKTAHIKHEPQPFVLQTSLDDFYVSYQINAYTEKAEMAAKIYSELHSHIQDGFNEAGVEIMSPHFRAARDGNAINIPPEYLPPNYKSPAFNFNVKNKETEGQ